MSSCCSDFEDPIQELTWFVSPENIFLSGVYLIHQSPCPKYAQYTCKPQSISTEYRRIICSGTLVTRITYTEWERKSTAHRRVCGLRSDHSRSLKTTQKCLPFRYRSFVFDLSQTPQTAYFYIQIPNTNWRRGCNCTLLKVCVSAKWRLRENLLIQRPTRTPTTFAFSAVLFTRTGTFCYCFVYDVNEQFCDAKS